MRSFRLGILLVAALTTQAPAETVLIDDFNDGNDDGWSHLDLLPATYGPGIFDASSFEYRLSSTGANPNPSDPGVIGAAWNASADPFYSNGLLRSKIRINEIGAGGGLVMRFTGLDSLYSFGAYYIDGEGRNGLYFDKTDPGNTTSGSTVINRGNFDLNQDWMLEAGAVGDRLTLKYWLVGEAEPTLPQWEWIDPNPLGAGMLGLRAGNDASAPNPVRLGATFDDIFFTSFPELAGDFGYDGVLDVADLDRLTVEILAGTSDPQFDVNRDGSIDGEDRLFWISDLKETFFGDTDLDGQVSAVDLNSLALNWLASDATSWAQGDFNGDGNVNASDLNDLGLNWQSGTIQAASAIPEPSSAVVLLLGSALLLRSHRRRGA